MTSDRGNQRLNDHGNKPEAAFVSPRHPTRSLPQVKNRDTRHAHERSERFAVHEWEGLRERSPRSGRDGSGSQRT